MKETKTQPSANTGMMMEGSDESNSNKEEANKDPALECDFVQSLEDEVAKSPEKTLKSSLRSMTSPQGVSKTPRPAFFDESPRHRTAMGEYIVPEGKQPLTRNAFPVAGPAEYMLPNLSHTHHRYPEWSIPNRNIYNPSGGPRPAPNTYRLPDTITLKNKFTFGKRQKFTRKAIAGPCKVGPTYNVKGHETGRNGLKYSFPRTPWGHFKGGLQSTLLHPQDIPGFRTPCAEAFDDSGIRPHSFHANFTSLPTTKIQETPGPDTYTKPELDPGLMKTFGMAKTDKFATDVPAPNQYNIDTLMGKGGPAYSITVPRKTQPSRQVPSPCAYMREREYDHKEKITMACRPITPVTGKTPAPNAYDICGPINPKRKPGVTIKSRTKGSYPFVCGDMERSPGPAAYSVFSDIANDKGVTIKKRYDNLDHETRPGPSDHGRVEVDPLSTKGRAPAYSIRSPWKPMKSEFSPGPAAYRLVPLSPGRSITLKSRIPVHRKQYMPPPNAYVPNQGCTRMGAHTDFGISMSSRRSPWVYSALKTPKTKTG